MKYTYTNKNAKVEIFKKGKLWECSVDQKLDECNYPLNHQLSCWWYKTKKEAILAAEYRCGKLVCSGKK